MSSTPVIDLARLLEAVIFNYLVGNNDAHGKNFALLYRGGGTGDLEIRLAPLYDRQHRVLSRDQPGHGDEDRLRISEKVTARNFEQLAEEAGFGKPLVRGRVHEMTDRVIAALARAEIAHPVAEQVADLIRQRSVKVRKSFWT